MFLLVAHHGDIDAAAEALHVRASELRIHLADLETLIGAPLLIDVQGNLLPTETGAVLIAPLRDAVQAAATADPRIGDIARALGLAGDETAPAPV
ncbi:helix-turn-helix domain-containing protein [Microbacterium sp. 2MCAF23]|uniref:helix-turn-helix domain-containing protein n=1 Tax=Microbacterium sp. 2MCAF23 TaxID=3232985 RepID=UPI003F95BCA9